MTYWWGVTLRPPELNEVSLAENVVIAVRAAAFREMYINSKVQKQSLGPRVQRTQNGMHDKIDTSFEHSGLYIYI